MTENIKPLEDGEEFISIDKAIEQVDNYKPPKAKSEDEKQKEIADDGTNRITKQGDVFVINDLTLYGLDGAAAVKYCSVEFDASPVCQNDILSQMYQVGWIRYYEDSGKCLPSLPLLYAIMEAAYDNRNEDAARDLLQSLERDFKRDWMSTSTRFNYDQQKVRHYVETPEQIALIVDIPDSEEYLDILVQSKDWQSPLKGIFMAKDIQKIPQVLGVYEKRPILLTPSKSRHHLCIAVAGFQDDHFEVDGYDDNVGFSRGVKILEKND